MENLGARSLDKLIQKEEMTLSEENEKNFDMPPLYENDSSPEEALEKQLKQTSGIEQQILDILFMNDKRLDMEEILEEVELDEVYYLRLKSKIQEIESKIKELKIAQANMQDERVRDIHKKLSQLSEKNEEYKGQLDSAQEILESYPETILKLAQELQEYDAFLGTYEDQANNFYNN